MTHPNNLLHLDMMRVSTDQHDWVGMHAVICCCAKEIVAFNIESRSHTAASIAHPKPG
jgi:hypothetical protein